MEPISPHSPAVTRRRPTIRLALLALAAGVGPRAVALAGAPPDESPPLHLTLEPGTDLTLHWIPPGDFAAGSALDAETAAARYSGDARFAHGEHPQRRVHIGRGFFLGRTEVTVAQFDAFVRASGYETTAERQGFGFRANPDGGWRRVPGLAWHTVEWEPEPARAVSFVTHEDARAFCRWASEATGRRMRLPRGDEWEYACGAEGRAFASGDGVTELERIAWSSSSRKSSPQPVATLEPGPNGLFDMHGNVWEWCHDAAPNATRNKLLKGGSYRNGPFMLRAAYSPFDDGSLVEPHLGFRVLVEGEEASTGDAHGFRFESKRQGIGPLPSGRTRPTLVTGKDGGTFAVARFETSSRRRAPARAKRPTRGTGRRSRGDERRPARPDRAHPAAPPRIRPRQPERFPCASAAMLHAPSPGSIRHAARARTAPRPG